MFAGGPESSVPVPECPRDTLALLPNCPDTSAPVWCCRSVLGQNSEVSWQRPHDAHIKASVA